MTPRKLALVVVAALATIGAVGALADVPTGRYGEDARSSLFLLALVILLAAGASLLFGRAGWTVPNVRPKGESPHGGLAAYWYDPDESGLPDDSDVRGPDSNGAAGGTR